MNLVLVYRPEVRDDVDSAYTIYYQVFPDCVLVVAVLHGRRNPKIWQSRV